jgi:hypothetical protein
MNPPQKQFSLNRAASRKQIPVSKLWVKRDDSWHGRAKMTATGFTK